MHLKTTVTFLLLLGSLSFYRCGTSSNITSKSDSSSGSTLTVKVEKKSIYDELISHGDISIDEVIERYFILKKDHKEEYNFEDERELNRYGYALMGTGRLNDAVEIFKLLVDEFPDSANPYDSLGEAYYKMGSKELALLNYQKSIDLNPRNTHAMDQVTIIKGLELLVTDWGKEFFHFPLHFAEEIPYKGVEEVVFPKNWIRPDSNDYWSYVFVWALEEKKSITAEELEENLTLYFDGLMSGLSRVDTNKLTKSEVHFTQNINPNDSVLFTGQLEIFDGFATQKPITLNARIFSDYCKRKNQLILLFRFSPLPYEHEIWNKLRTVKVRSTVCEK